MPVDQGRAHRHDGVVPVAEQLREIFGANTQMQISEHLRANGLDEGSQTTVSAWLRGSRVPTNDQLAKIEDIYGVERGTILVRAGYISDAAKELTPTPAGDDVSDLVAALRQAVTKSDGRDSKLDQIIALCHDLATNQLRVARTLEANEQRLAALIDHFGLEVVLEPTPPR